MKNITDTSYALLFKRNGITISIKTPANGLLSLQGSPHGSELAARLNGSRAIHQSHYLILSECIVVDCNFIYNTVISMGSRIPGLGAYNETQLTRRVEICPDRLSRDVSSVVDLAVYPTG